MKIQVKAIAACFLVSSGIIAIAQTTNNSQHHPPTTSKSSKSTQAKPMQMDMCKTMMAEKKTMMAHMNQMDKMMQDLVSKMDSSTGEAKVAATAAAVKEMVAQRIMTNKANAAVDEKMMEHMMMHMKSGKMDCPMMKGMKGM